MLGAIAASIAAPMIGGMAQGLFGKRNFGSTYDRDMMARRQAEINGFAAQMTAARGNYKNTLSKMYETSYANFMPMAEAKFAGRGMQVSGGAYAAALAKESANNEANMAVQLSQAEREDAQTIASMQTGLYNSAFAASNQDLLMKNNAARQSEANLWGGVGSALGGAASMYGQEQILDARTQKQNAFTKSMYDNYFDKGQQSGGRGLGLGDNFAQSPMYFNPNRKR